MGGILCERVQDVGNQQFLMLLFVIEADLDDGSDVRKIVGRFDQFHHGGVDMGAIAGDLGGVGPGDEAAFGSRVPRAGRHIIGIEKICEALVESTVGGSVRLEQELFEKPGCVGAVPLGRARVRHRLHDLIFRREECGAAFGLAAHRAKGLKPPVARMDESVSGGCGRRLGKSIEFPAADRGNGLAQHTDFRRVAGTGFHDSMVLVANCSN